jgi:hypothetical protein
MFQREAGYDPENKDWFYAVYAPNGNVVVNPLGMNMASALLPGCPTMSRSAASSAIRRRQPAISYSCTTPSPCADLDRPRANHAGGEAGVIFLPGTDGAGPYDPAP